VKKKFLFLFLVPLLIVGCTQIVPRLEVHPQDTIGTIMEGEDGFLVRWLISGGEGEVCIDFGDGVEDCVQGQSASIWIEHSYTQIGKYEVNFHRGTLRGNANVSIAGPDFVLYMPEWSNGCSQASFERGELVLFDPFPRSVGCDNGVPIYASGVWPKNTDYYKIDGPRGLKWDIEKLVQDFEIRVTLWNPNGSYSPVYGKDAQEISNEWVPLQTFRIFAGSTIPPIPLPVLPKGGCGDDECEDPWQIEPVPEDAGRGILRLEVRNRWGRLHVIQIDYYVASGCGG